PTSRRPRAGSLRGRAFPGAGNPSRIPRWLDGAIPPGIQLSPFRTLFGETAVTAPCAGRVPEAGYPSDAAAGTSPRGAHSRTRISLAGRRSGPCPTTLAGASSGGPAPPEGRAAGRGARAGGGRSGGVVAEVGRQGVAHQQAGAVQAALDGGQAQPQPGADVG